MNDISFPWQITARDVIDPPQQSLPPAYKPSLTVDVGVPSQEVNAGLGVTPKASQTPHVATNIFVAGLPLVWGDEDLRNHYKEFGDIISTKVVDSKHFGFVMFKTPAAAHAAINATHLTRPTPNCPTLLHVSIAMHDEGADDVPNERIFVRGLPQWATKEHLRQSFSAYGTVQECAVLMNPLGQCKGSGFVQFTTTAEATAAVRAKDQVIIENWSHQLEIKFSETDEVRQQRQERNRNRQKLWANSPKYRGNSTASLGSMPSPGSAAPSPGAGMNIGTPPYSFFPSQLPLLPSPQGFPSLVSPMPFPMMYSQPSPLQSSSLPSQAATGSVSPASQRPTQIVYPQPVRPFYQSPAMLVIESPPLPQKGDLHFSGRPVSEDLLRILLQPYGAIDLLKVLDESDGGGIAIRMKNPSQHHAIAQQLNGTIFPSGELLSAGLYA